VLADYQFRRNTMAGILLITEYEEMAFAGAAIQAPQEPALAVQEIPFAASTASATLNAATKFVSVQLTSNGHIAFGAAPTAVNTSGTASSRIHEANAVSFHGVPVGGTYKIAAVDAA
jgi:hypothetical protein